MDGDTTAVICLRGTSVSPGLARGPLIVVADDTHSASREPGSASLYFHQNAYTASGDKLVVTTPKGVSTLNSKQARSN